MEIKQKALNMMAKGMGTSEVAKQLGVSQRTIQRWIKSEGVSNPVMDICDEVVRRVAVRVDATIGDELKLQALQLLRLSGKSLNCLEEIIDNPETRTADRLKACQIVGEWVGFDGRADLLSHTLGKFGLQVAITPTGDKTIQERERTYPLERDYIIAQDANGQVVDIRKTLD
jgi:transcriptional regulator with XRE-family HTH domain